MMVDPQFDIYHTVSFMMTIVIYIYCCFMQNVQRSRICLVASQLLASTGSVSSRAVAFIIVPLLENV